MINKFVKGKTAVFIDWSNIYYSCKELKWKIDFVNLIEYLKKETDLFKIFFYTAYDPDNRNQKRFIYFLETNML